jgi:TRAP-type mannitol/chloroaromatic compound transport system permease small subunit
VESLKKLVKRLDTFSEWWGRLFSWIILGLVALSCFEVFTRRLLGKPTIWTHEILSYIFCGTVLLFMGYTQLYKGHANIDILYERFSAKTRAILDLITLIIFMGVFSAIYLVDGFIFAKTSWQIHERTPSAFNFIIYPAKTLIPVGAILLTLQFISDLLKKIVFLAKGEQL